MYGEFKAAKIGVFYPKFLIGKLFISRQLFAPTVVLAQKYII
jgi:hypothetical protein